MLTKTDDVRKWANGWIEYAAQGNPFGVKMIRKHADQIKDAYCTNGAWNPDGQAAYNILIDAENKARSRCRATLQRYDAEIEN